MRIVCETKEKAAAAAGERVAICLHEAKGPSLLLLSGGSSFDILAHIALPPSCHDLTIGVADERFSQDPEVNNFLKLKSTIFYATAQARGASFIDTSVASGESLEHFAARYEAALKIWRRANPKAPIVATIGVGPDGHMLGIMPFPEDAKRFRELYEGETWVIPFDASGKNQHTLRAATTATFLRNEVTASVAYIVGENKRKASESIFASKGSVPETPGRLLLEMEEVRIFTDIQPTKDRVYV